MNDLVKCDLVDIFQAIAAAIEAEKGRLSELDGVIGDADHGVTMSIGFSAISMVCTTGTPHPSSSLRARSV